ncbi:DUF2971 domain-containing protein [Marinomonas primoryensis]|uniref:DUF2971 domain-containing protein n=1 Tax=Marinomonas primoryensis TaxID=178399 RepID=UPI0030DB595D|tara:strand:+ start:13006 stop:13833 length:828 start_codon:yes stop_codon:yes gene_type:complete
MLLYKYYSPESYSYIFTPKGISVRFSQPSVLNDIFEANGTLDLESDETLLGFMKAQINDDERFNNFKTPYLSFEAAFRKIIREDIKKDYLKEAQKENDSSVGILSLSENKNSRTMWSYYANSHKGFMVEFDFNLDESYFDFRYFSEKVTYTEERPLSIREHLTRYGKLPKDHEAFKFMSSLWSTKDKDWEKEQEFRVMANISDIKTTKVDEDGHPIHSTLAPSEIVKAIYLGARSSEALERKVTSWIKTTAPNVELYKAKACQTTYKMLYDKVKI